MKATTLQVVRRYLELGFSVIPVQKGQKKPALSTWKEYQTRQPTAQEIEEWFSDSDNGPGIVCGKISGVLVLDADSEAGRKELESLIPDSLLTPICKTPKGWHYYFKHPGGRITSTVRILPDVDIRADGTQVVAPPSVGRKWIVSPNKAALAELPDSIKQVVCNGSSGSLDNSSSYSYSGLRARTMPNGLDFGQGLRDESLFHIATVLRRGGMAQPDAEKVLEMLAKTTDPPFPTKEAMVKVRSAYSRVEESEKSLAEVIREWVLMTPGDFSVTDVDRDLTLLTRTDKNNRAKVLERLVKDGLIERAGNRRGWYRLIERDSHVLDWRNADTSTTIDLIWPFHIERLVTLYPKNVVVVAGSPNAGKTALLLNLIRLNMVDHRIAYFSSEMGPEELKLRLNNFQDVGQDEWKFEAYDRSANFADAVQPNAINLIDYLEVTTDFFKVGGEIKAIYDKLDKGVAVIALQKKKGAEYGRGAEFSLEKARLYLSMDDGELRIVKAKNWGPDAKETGNNPNGRIYHFSLVGGCKFVGRYNVGSRQRREREPGEEG